MVIMYKHLVKFLSPLLSYDVVRFVIKYNNTHLEYTKEYV